MILNNEPLGVLSSKKNTFKIYYPSENDNTKDLIIIIGVIDNKNIKVITIYENELSKREGRD